VIGNNMNSCLFSRSVLCFWLVWGVWKQPGSRMMIQQVPQMVQTCKFVWVNRAGALARTTHLYSTPTLTWLSMTAASSPPFVNSTLFKWNVRQWDLVVVECLIPSSSSCSSNVPPEVFPFYAWVAPLILFSESERGQRVLMYSTCLSLLARCFF